MVFVVERHLTLSMNASASDGVRQWMQVAMALSMATCGERWRSPSMAACGKRRWSLLMAVHDKRWWSLSMAVDNKR